MPFAPGIQFKDRFGNPIKGLTQGQLVDYILHKHITKRNPNRSHYDLRLGTPKTDLYSWVIPKSVLPEPGTKRLAKQTQLHDYEYGDFRGEIESGYGAGTVDIEDKGKALITNITKNTISFTLAHKRVPVKYTLIHVGGPDKKLWYLVADIDNKMVPGLGKKPIIKTIKNKDADQVIKDAIELQEKIDGAHGIVYIDKNKNLNVYSIRESTSGQPIRHTERLQLFGIKLPKLKDTAYRGEIYFIDNRGNAIPFKEVSALLNANIERSLLEQKNKNLRPQIALFDTIQYKGKQLEDNVSLEERRKRIKEFIDYIYSDKKFDALKDRNIFHEPYSVRELEDKLKLIKDIKSGKNKRTREGVIAIMPDGTKIKLKNKNEITAYLTGIYRGKGKRKHTAGGLLFTLNPNELDKPTGRVGTGFTDEELNDIIENLEEYRGKPIRLEYQEMFDSGKLRAPSFLGFETDK